MKEFIEKLIGRLEELKEIEKNRADSCDEDGCGDGEQIFDDGRSQGRFEQTHKIIQIVKELAEEYINTSSDTSEDYRSTLERYYEKGLNDAWELARKIFTFNDNKIKEIFGVAGKRSAFDDLSPQVALAKLEAYEKEQNEIKVGDVIICYDKEGVVTKVDDNYFNIIYEDGSSDKISQIICKDKPGKLIDIQSLLEQIKE